MNTSPLWLELKYLNLISPKLERFHQISSSTFSCRCWVCGDSKKSKLKTRGYFFVKDDQVHYKCHNCGVSFSSFQYLLKTYFPYEFEEFKLEQFKENKIEFKKEKIQFNEIKEHTTQKVYKINELFYNRKNILEYPENSEIRKYVNYRKIPEKYQSELYFVPRFMEWINEFIPGKFLDYQLKTDEPRLVIPFFDENKNIFAVAGRSFRKNSIKYLTIKFDDSYAKIYGFDHIDNSKKVYVVEGPIDSFFVANCIAFAGSSGKIPKFNEQVIILDNEPRNKEIVKLNERFILSDYDVCIWPKSFKHKDINEAIIDGITKEEMKSIIDTNTYSGLLAKLKFIEWKRV